MGKLTRYLGKLEVSVDGEEMELDVILEDKAKLLAIQRKYANDIDASIKAQMDKFKEIIKRSYPDSTDAEIEAFLIKKFEKFLMEFSIAVGWGTRADFENSFRKEGIDGKTETDKVT